MVISIALLGFGSAGTFLSILKHRMKEKYEILSSTLTLITALLISLSVSLSQTDIFYFDSYKIFTGSSQLVKLFGFYLLFTSPFFCGALVIGLSFVRFTNDIGILYFSNMAGSGLGAVLFLLFASHLNVENIPSVISILTILAIIISLKNYTKKKSLILILLIILSISTLFFISPTLIFSEYKGFSKILSLPDSEIFVKENSVHGEISLIKSPSLRYAPGLSLVFKNKVPTSNSAFVNGNWKGPLIDSDAQHKQIFTSSTVHLPYIISEREKNIWL